MEQVPAKYGADCNKNNPTRCVQHFEDDKHIEDAEEANAQQATSLVPTRAAGKPSGSVGR